MTLRTEMLRVFEQEDVNFLLTNRIPRRLLTRFMGWFSQIEQPLVRDLSIGLWRFFSDLDLSEAKKTDFRSMHECFTRELKDGARPVEADPSILMSPCDAIVGAGGAIAGTDLFQVKGFPYTLRDLLGRRRSTAIIANGRFVTLRLTSSMYHRFHAPHDCRVEQVTYISGDTWNVNPIALKRVEKLFCKNERAVMRTRLTPGGHVGDAGAGRGHPGGQHPAAFPRCAAQSRHRGPNVIPCACVISRKATRWAGSSMARPSSSWRPKGFSPCDNVRGGRDDPDGPAADALALIYRAARSA